MLNSGVLFQSLKLFIPFCLVLASSGLRSSYAYNGESRSYGYNDDYRDYSPPGYYDSYENENIDTNNDSDYVSARGSGLDRPKSSYKQHDSGIISVQRNPGLSTTIGYGLIQASSTTSSGASVFSNLDIANVSNTSINIPDFGSFNGPMVNFLISLHANPSRFFGMGVSFFSFHSESSEHSSMSPMSISLDLPIIYLPIVPFRMISVDLALGLGTMIFAPQKLVMPQTTLEFSGYFSPSPIVGAQINISQYFSIGLQGRFIFPGLFGFSSYINQSPNGMSDFGVGGDVSTSQPLLDPPDIIPKDIVSLAIFLNIRVFVPFY